MKELRFLTATFLTLSLVGCCCGRNIVMDPCDPCGGAVNQCSGCRPWIFPWNWFSCGCGSCAYSGGCGCNACSMASNGGDIYGMGSNPGCGCSQPSAFSDSGYPNMSYPNSTTSPYIDGSNGGQSAPTLRSAPAPEPPVGSPTTKSIIIPPSIPGTESTMMYQNSYGGQPQVVSYEEFQRLPGTIISGPGAVTTATTVGAPSQIQQASASNQPFLAPPAPSATPAVLPGR